MPKISLCNMVINAFSSNCMQYYTSWCRRPSQLLDVHQTACSGEIYRSVFSNMAVFVSASSCRSDNSWIAGARPADIRPQCNRCVLLRRLQISRGKGRTEAAVGMLTGCAMRWRRLNFGPTLSTKRIGLYDAIWCHFFESLLE